MHDDLSQEGNKMGTAYCNRIYSQINNNNNSNNNNNVGTRKEVESQSFKFLNWNNILYYIIYSATIQCYTTEVQKHIL